MSTEQNTEIPVLPFVVLGEGDEVDFWEVEPVGDLQQDYARGLEYGILAVEAAKISESPMLLSFILRDMIIGGEFGALEAGFLAVVASSARAGALH